MEADPELPIPISLIAGRYLLFSIDAVTFLRREHHICGVLIGSLPQAPQQNVFLGLPLELMPEEVRLLVEKGLAYLVDDVRAHQEGLTHASPQRKLQYVNRLRDAGRQAALSQAAVKEQRRVAALSKARPKATKGLETEAVSLADKVDDSVPEALHQASLFAPPSPSEPAASESISASLFGVTPATSASLFSSSPPPGLPGGELPAAPDSYPLFKHLHSKGYFTSPGLRFGCQYMVYPGDPLRFHSHFLASHVGWDEELDLMDLVAGGRLGTGVKKGYLIGGLEKKTEKEKHEEGHRECENVRTFSIEWAGM
jgi:tRNA-splicing endonuclease subunit Sen34